MAEFIAKNIFKHENLKAKISSAGTIAIDGEKVSGNAVNALTDLKLLDDAGVSIKAYTKGSTVGTTPSPYWLASRYYFNSESTYWYFSARTTEAYKGLWGKYSGKMNAYVNTSYIRPIVTLKSGLTISSGNGTASSHYVLSVS